MGVIPKRREFIPRAPDAPAHHRAGREAPARASLPGTSLAPAAARRFLRDTVTDWSERALDASVPLSDGLADDAVLVVSELVTNAVVHAGTDVEVLCRLEPADGESDGALVVEVSDRHPSRAPRDEADSGIRPYGTPEYGRGLRLVAALSEAWGITYRTGIKTVWARLPAGGVLTSGPTPPDGHGTGGTPLTDGGPPAGERTGAYGEQGAHRPTARTGEVPAAPEPVRSAGGHGWLRRGASRGALSFLAEASDLLAGQLDEDLVAALTGQLLVPRLADWCAVWLEDEATDRAGGLGMALGPRLARVWHTSEDRVEELRTALEKDPPRVPDAVRSRPVPVPWPGEPWAPPDGAGQPADRRDSDSGSGAPVPHDTATPQATAGTPDGRHRSPDRTPDAHHRTPDHTPAARDRTGAALAYRLIAGGRPLGTLVIGRAGAAGFPDEITGLVEDLSRRVALAIGAARQYARQATISRVLQRGLLPGAVAEIPGVRSALVYEPCDKGGPSGDFYDLFPAGDGRWCFAVGDVQGKGPEAAVVIGLARPWLRLLAREGYQVADVLDRLNQLLLDDATEAADAAARALVAAGDPGLADPEGPQTRFLSLLYGELVPFEGGVRCTVASAGHPLPLLLDPAGGVREVALPQTLLGVIEDETYTADTFELRPGDTLLCVTDGVTERRSGSRQLDDADGLATALAGCAGLSAQLIAERIRGLVHEFGSGPPEDDLALLVLQAERAADPAPAGRGEGRQEAPAGRPPRAPDARAGKPRRVRDNGTHAFRTPRR
ncbi:SpoIIE family protein phosphatase [Streptomyces sp. NPDC008313]|uniref:SpoIIE family protein phosphatase n=1 Tax=Streptomyces sp. NPDC008313 TaxID=3364826 RepID=UPI0036EBC7FC